jgi:hypothetical protein
MDKVTRRNLTKPPRWRRRIYRQPKRMEWLIRRLAEAQKPYGLEFLELIFTPSVFQGRVDADTN